MQADSEKKDRKQSDNFSVDYVSNRIPKIHKSLFLDSIAFDLCFIYDKMQFKNNAKNIKNENLVNVFNYIQ